MKLNREQVLRAAADFLSRRPNATQDEIAAAVGISRATLHRYFAGRAALLEALDQLAVAHMHEALKTARWQDGSATEAVQRLVTACEPVSGYLMLLYTQSQDFDANQANEAWAEIDAEIRQLFQRGQRDGEFRPDLSAVWLTEALYNLVAGAAWVIQVGRAARHDFTEMITELLLHGVDPVMTRSWLALGVLSLGVLVIGVDGTVLAVATPLITKNLESTATQIFWIGDIYSFVLAGLLVTMGSLGDRIGHKRLLLGSATAFAGMSVATAYAPTAELLIGARALLGVAGAALAPSTLALVRGLFPRPRERSMAVGVWAAMFSAGTALGPVIGGLLLEHFWWGSVFLINVPVMVVLLVGGIVLLPEQCDPRPGPFDLPSVGLSLLGMVGLVYAVKEGAANGLRVDIAMVGVVGAAALTLFVRRQLRLPAPLIDVRLFGNRAFSGVVAANLLSVLGLSGLVFFLSQFFQLVQGYSPMRAGLAELPAAVAATVFGVLAGVALRYWSQRAVLTTGLALVGVAMASLTLISPSTGYPWLGSPCSSSASASDWPSPRPATSSSPTSRRSELVRQRRSRRPPTNSARRSASRYSGPSSPRCTAGWRFRPAPRMPWRRVRGIRSPLRPWRQETCPPTRHTAC